jgi:tRNA uridine 5-carboxymethylaminomethyl modification enzyme
MATKKSTSSDVFDVIVVGAGHAGIEAAHASGRLGCKTLLVTMSVDAIGKISCNPAVGGIAKSHLVREVDALGGVQARLTDMAAMQYRVLNASKGKAVRATRVQIDKYEYNRKAVELMLAAENVETVEAEVKDLIITRGAVAGVKTNIGEFRAPKVVITAGTFLEGVIHIGMQHWSGGRIGELAANDLFASLRDAGVTVRKFKTGTCARLDSRTVDLSVMEEQKPDTDVAPFSFYTKKTPYNGASCFVTYTNKKTHAIIKKGLKYSPLYTGKIKSTGVRYCPSIEDKIVRFADRDRHHVFIEPEGRDTVELYPNGCSTSLPFDVQYDMLRSIEGLEKVHIIRPGYGIEHGVIDSRELKQTFEHKNVKGLYFGGQVNGTTGYEEAAAQGLYAGVNAALAVQKKEPFILHREESFIGMLVDDLVTKGTNEPYRVFTSRSEFRLLLREDNALYRLYAKAHEIGLIDDAAYAGIKEKEERIAAELSRLKSVKIKADIATNAELKSRGTKELDETVSAEQLLKRPEVAYADLTIFGVKALLATDEADQVEIAIKYQGFIQREQRNAQSLKDLAKIKIPLGFSYAKIDGLSSEIKEKLASAKPVNLREAQDISGVTPASLLILMGYLRKKRHALGQNSL